MQTLQFLLLGTMAVLPLCSFGAVNVDFSSGKFSSDGQHMATGKNGHAQAALDSQGSLIRFGSNTQADLGNEREVTLTKGLLLVSSGEGFLRRSGVVIHTPEGNITVRGTVLVAVLPDGAVKLTCLEGSVRGDLGGHGVSLHPGELIIQRGDGTRDIVQVNLHALASTCALLVGGGFKPLQFAGSIDKAVAQQDKAIAADHQHSAGQHLAGHSQGDSTSFLARLFSWNGNATNNLGGSTGGAAFAISQGGTFNGASTISNAGGTFTLSGSSSNAILGNTPFISAGTLAISGTVNSNPPEAALTAGSNSHPLLLASSGGTTLDLNNSVGNTNSGSSSISGSSITFNSGFTNTNINATNLVITNTGVGTLALNTGTVNLSDVTFSYNGQVYHGQDAVNLINSLQHPTTPSTP